MSLNPLLNIDRSLITYKVPENLLSDGMTNAKTKKNNVKTFILYIKISYYPKYFTIL